jgi:hypothetical protein
MKLIAHRANINNENENENSPEKIENAISMGFDVEVDLRIINHRYFLGHDEPDYETSFDFLLNYKDYLWIHCKDIQTLYELSKTNLNYFFHDNDDVTLTSENQIWTFPNKVLTLKSIAVMPELSNYSLDDLRECYGICSDNILWYKEQLDF